MLAYVEAHYAEKIQISELSEIIHVCDDRLIRLFKEVTGETPIEYIMNLRIEAGIKLLSATEFSIVEIAEQPLSDKSLRNFRKRCYKYEQETGNDLIHTCIVSLSKEIARVMEISGRTRRMPMPPR